MNHFLKGFSNEHIEQFGNRHDITETTEPLKIGNFYSKEAYTCSLVFYSSFLEVFYEMKN